MYLEPKTFSPPKPSRFTKHSLRSLLSLACIGLAFTIASSLGFSSLRSPLHAQEPESLDLDARLARGKAIYESLCLSCHGAMGEGVAGQYENALTGDSTIGELSKLIHDTMPKDEAEQCVGPDAEWVAEYIHHRFYSEAAQIRNRPPRVGLAHLTAPQLRQSVADLYSHWSGVPGRTSEHGVNGRYFNGDRWNKDELKTTRIDPVIQFDFGRESPVEGVGAKKFYIYWEGAIKPVESGRYEIIVRSTCSFVFDLGKLGRQFIDNHVQSGDKTEFRRSIYLTAGRVYPFKFDFIQRERKTEQPPAQISLSWIPPKGVEEVIPNACLIPTWAPPAFPLQAILPPDDRSYGFDRGIAINREWEEATTMVAFEFGQMAVDELWPEYRKKHKDEPQENRQPLRNFLTEMAGLAFRGPLDPEQTRWCIDEPLQNLPDDADAIRQSLLLMLKSPRFLYPLLDQDRTVSRRVGNRLALTLWDSLPADPRLLAVIDKDELQSEEQIRNAAWQMLEDYRTEAKVQEMFQEWLNIRHVAELVKDRQAYPEYDAALVSDLRNSLNLFLSDVFWSEASDFRQLFTADWGYTNERISKFFGDAWNPANPSDRSLVPSVRDGRMHLGVLNHPFMMSSLAYHQSTSPIHRGVFLIRYMMGRTLRPPDAAVAPLSPDLHPDLTTRERVNLQTSPESCQVCHIKINGLGYTLENFDAVGRFRDSEKGQPINASGEYISTAGESVRIENPQQLAEYLANSWDARRGFVQRAFQYFAKQPVGAYGAETLDRLTQQFSDQGCNMKQLIVEIAAITAMHDTVHHHPPSVEKGE